MLPHLALRLLQDSMLRFTIRRISLLAVTRVPMFDEHLNRILLFPVSRWHCCLPLAHLEGSASECGVRYSVLMRDSTLPSFERA
jgi:hypothetical protein